MTSSRLGGFLLGVGAAVGLAAVVGLVVGFEPARLPPALLNIAVYKLTFAAGAGLLAAGAAVQRYAWRSPNAAADPSMRPTAVERERPMLPEPVPDPIADQRDRDLAQAVRKHSL